VRPGSHKPSVILEDKKEMQVAEDAVFIFKGNVDLSYKFELHPPQEFVDEEAEFVLDSLKKLVASTEYDVQDTAFAKVMLREYKVAMLQRRS
jgi:hypothetical protein